MLHHLPRRHRALLAVGLFLEAAVAGAWTSTRVGDDSPTTWGVALGVLTGGALAGVLLLRGRATAPVRR